MATECRRTKGKRINRNRLMKVYAYIILMLLVVFGGVIGLFIGRFTAPAEVEIQTVTETVTVEVPVYEADKLPEVSEVFYYDIPLSDSLQRYIYEICADEKVPVTLVLAMIEHESYFNPEIVSATDDYGLMQINAVNHEWLEEDYRCADMLNPYQNVFCGVKIVSTYIDKYDGDLTKALMAYNMGNYGARTAWENGITSTSYTDSILGLMQKYEEVSHNADGDRT